VAKHFASRFCHRFFRQNFFGARVEATKSLTKVKLFFVAKRFATRQNIPSRVLTKCFLVLPQIFAKTKSSNFRPNFCWNFVKLELKQRNLWRNFNDFFTIMFVWKKVWQNGLPEKMPRNLQRNLRWLIPADLYQSYYKSRVLRSQIVYHPVNL